MIKQTKETENNCRKSHIVVIMILMVMLVATLCSCAQDEFTEKKVVDHSTRFETEKAGSVMEQAEDDVEPTSHVAKTELLDVEETQHIHNYDKQEVAQTCTNSGYTVYRCLCGDAYNTDWVESLGHDYDSNVIEPVNDCQGYTSHVCSRCGDRYNDNYVSVSSNEHEIHFSEINETVYASTTINVRSGPGTDYERVGSLYLGQPITRIGVGDNGWSKVLYDDKECYVHSDYLSNEISHVDIVEHGDVIKQEEVKAENYVGRFKIPSGNVDVACYDSNSQDTVDANDSAAYYYGLEHMIIADHVNQGFDGIKSCEEGTVAKMETSDGTVEYTCVEKIIGYNTGSALTDINGNVISEIYPGSLACYTCNKNPGEVTIVFFTPVDNGDVPNETAASDNSTNDTSNDDSNNNDTNASVDNNANNTSNTDNNSANNTYWCEDGNHCWGELEVAWEALEADGNYCGWDKRICNTCGYEEWITRTEPSPTCERVVAPEPIDTTEPIQPSETQQSEVDESVCDADVATENATEDADNKS